MNASSKLILLDRDGVLNVDRGYVHKMENWTWCDGAVEAVHELHKSGYAVMIVTNQSGIAYGYYTVEDYLILMHQVQTVYNSKFPDVGEWEKQIFRIAARCPHAAVDDCRCRKPRTGMWDNYVRPIFHATFGSLPNKHVWFVDDKLENLAFGRKLGMNMVWINPDPVEGEKDYAVHSSLHQFAESLLGKEIPWQNQNVVAQPL